MDHQLSSLAGIELLSDALAKEKDLSARLGLISKVSWGPVAFSTSLGLEDQALLHAIATSQAPIAIFTLDTGRHFPQTLETLAISEARYGIRIKVIVPDANELEELVARDGIKGFRRSVEARKACCNVRKVRPLRRALQGAAGWITGLRRGQSPSRESVPFCEIDHDLGLIKYNPLADWPEAALRAYIEANSIPVNPLHAMGFPSIGCQPCTRAIEPGEHIRAGRWWWENPEQSECGLHSRFSGSLVP